MWAAGSPPPCAGPPAGYTPSEYQIIWVTTSQGSILKLYRQIYVELEVDTASFSGVILTKLIKKQVLEIAQDRKKKSALIINEAFILKLQVLAELHTITQFQGDSKPILSIILAGQNNLTDLLIIYRTYLSLASSHGQKSSSQPLPPGHAGLPPAPSQSRRRQTELFL
ncbi:hypothetical protein DFAR_1130003 [Desulfarculales bacterium]